MADDRHRALALLEEGALEARLSGLAEGGMRISRLASPFPAGPSIDPLRLLCLLIPEFRQSALDGEDGEEILLGTHPRGALACKTAYRLTPWARSLWRPEPDESDRPPICYFLDAGPCWIQLGGVGPLAVHKTRAPVLGLIQGRLSPVPNQELHWPEGERESCGLALALAFALSCESRGAPWEEDPIVGPLARRALALRCREALSQALPAQEGRVFPSSKSI